MKNNKNVKKLLAASGKSLASVGETGNCATTGPSSPSLELKHVLQAAKSEIQELRQTNQNLSLRLSGFDDAMKLLNARDGRQLTGMKECPIWQLDLQIQILEKQNQ